MDDLKFHSLLALYYYGDQVGAVAEGASPGAVSYERAITEGPKRYPHGTDESDTVRLFVDWAKSEDTGESLANWCDYHERNRRVTTYGKTWRDHFATVKSLRKQGVLKFGRLTLISMDRDSLGNGALNLVFPSFALGLDLLDMHDLVKITHAHEDSLTVARELFLYFSQNSSGYNLLTRSFGVTQKLNLPFDPETFNLTELAPHCLCAAIITSMHKTVEDCIRFALSKGGDVDSYLSLGLLLWGFRQ